MMYDYAYDPIGNRLSATEYAESGDALVSAYSANALNQYTQRTVPGTAQVRGFADSGATVTVNGNGTWRSGEYFYGGDEADNSALPVFKEVAIEALRSAPTPDDYDEIAAVTGRVFVAQTPELFTYDANGNVSEYVSTNGGVVAHYDYSPFGEPLVTSGPLAATFTHQFSTKPYCTVTGFSEYQMRNYRPDIGRWMSRDPIGERGGINQLSFANNNSGASFDRLGLLTQSNGCKCYEHSFVDPSGKEESYVIKQKWQECSKR